MSVDWEERERILQQVEQWLDALGEAEPAPLGVPDELLTDNAPDLFSLLGGLAALTREVQLGSRATHRLHGDITAAVSQLAEVGRSREQQARDVADARRDARREVAHELVGLRERFARGLAEAEQALGSRRLFARMAFGGTVRTLIEGSRLTLDRVDELLRRLDVREIPAAGKPFDPHLMRVVETTADRSVPPDTVSKVVRAGYLFGDQVLRHADVVVRPGLQGESNG
jgi:molecular chaperone GrpE